MPQTFRTLRPACVLTVFATLGFAASLTPSATAQQTAPAQGATAPEPPKIDWHRGPYIAKLGTVAELKVPDGYEFTDGDGARKYLELTGNPSQGTEIGLLTPTSKEKKDDWVILFDFDNSGYVKDDEKASIDAPKLLDSMKRGTEKENEERKKRGWMPFHISGWQTMPFYDETTHNLTWGTVGATDDPKLGQTINYATRLLGRRGVVRVDLVTDPEQVASTVPEFKQLMAGFTFATGSRYADFVKGDKVAEYGLTALIAGGATAVALKTGLFAKLLALLAGLWKIILVGLAALASRVKQIFAKIKGLFSGEEKAPTVDDH